MDSQLQSSTTSLRTYQTLGASGQATFVICAACQSYYSTLDITLELVLDGLLIRLEKLALQGCCPCGMNVPQYSERPCSYPQLHAHSLARYTQGPGARGQIHPFPCVHVFSERCIMRESARFCDSRVPEHEGQVRFRIS